MMPLIEKKNMNSSGFLSRFGCSQPCTTDQACTRGKRVDLLASNGGAYTLNYRFSTESHSKSVYFPT
jgi:hypothetical protein